MKKAIVTTTINPPTKALEKFARIAEKDDWVLIVVGDKKTPYTEYTKFMEDHPGRVIYLGIEAQEEMSKELSDLIGWNCIQRRNFGFIYALKDPDCEIIATVDDDNIPLENWGKDITLGMVSRVQLYTTEQEVFNPLFWTKDLWHRGFPIQLLQQKECTARPTGLKKMVPLVQADLWNGDPDVDAIERIAFAPELNGQGRGFYTGSVPGPFNSQNTFLHRSVFPTYFLFPHIGRMDDIWAGYLLQAKMPDSVVYGPPTVFQQRNPHDLSKDLEAELIGYRHSLDFVRGLAKGGWEDYLPDEAKKAYFVWNELLK